MEGAKAELEEKKAAREKLADKIRTVRYATRRHLDMRMSVCADVSMCVCVQLRACACVCAYAYARALACACLCWVTNLCTCVFANHSR